MRRKTPLLVSVAAAAFALALLAPTVGSAAGPPDRSDKRVQILCQPGWRGTAVGTYGGASFAVSCNNGRGTTRIAATEGTAYSIRMGVESDTGGFDCFFTGDAPVVQEACASVRLQIR